MFSALFSHAKTKQFFKDQYIPVKKQSQYTINCNTQTKTHERQENPTKTTKESVKVNQPPKQKQLTTSKQTNKQKANEIKYKTNKQTNI